MHHYTVDSCLNNLHKWELNFCSVKAQRFGDLLLFCYCFQNGMTGFSIQSIMRLKLWCWPGWVLIQMFWKKIHLKDHSCWKNSVSWGCSTKVPISLLTVSQGHSQLQEVTTFLSMRPSPSSNHQWCIRCVLHFGSLNSLFSDF